MKTPSTAVLAATLLMLASFVCAAPPGGSRRFKLDLKKDRENVMRAVPEGTPLPPIMESATFYDIPPDDYASTEDRHLEYIRASQPERQASLPRPVSVPMGGLVRDDGYRLTGVMANRLRISPEAVAQATQRQAEQGEWMPAPQRLRGMLPPEMRMDSAGPLEPWNQQHVIRLRGDALDEAILNEAKKMRKSFYALDTDGAVYFFNTMDRGKTFTWTDHVQANDANMIRNWVGTEEEKSRWAELVGSSSAAQGGGRKFGRLNAFSPNRVGPHMLKSQSALTRSQAEAAAERARTATGVVDEPFSHGGEAFAGSSRSAAKAANAAAEATDWRKILAVLEGISWLGLVALAHTVTLTPSYLHCSKHRNILHLSAD